MIEERIFEDDVESLKGPSHVRCGRGEDAEGSNERCHAVNANQQTSI